ncbi:MAG: hypothetical protein Q8K30_01015 [Candidatus Gracilibacteria bacterium]|nr:hypothetical protein [Candidatus Gracilibacteria bacterium]
MRKKSIQNMIDGKWELTNHIKEETYIKFDENLDFFLLKGQDFVLFFEDTKNIDESLKLFSENFKAKGLFSEEIESGIQVPEVIGPFDYNGKIGLWINAKNSLNDFTNIEKGIYRGVIVNPSKYFEVNKEVKSSSEKVSSVLN